MSNKALRVDLLAVASLVKDGASVIDIGCGDGELLKFLQNNKNVKGRGLEIDPYNVTKAVSKGLAVVQGDADNDLKNYPTNAVDYAILSQTLQATKYPDQVLKEMMRIAKYGIVSFPNFGYWKNRLYLGFKGKMPVTKTLDYQWYETPNIHFCTIKDFVILCNDLGFKIDEQCYTSSKNDRSFHKYSSISIANLIGEFGIFLIGKGLQVNDGSQRNAEKVKFKNSTIPLDATLARDNQTS